MEIYSSVKINVIQTAILVVLYDHWKSNFTHLLKHHALGRQYNKVKIEEIWDTMEI